MDRYKCISLYQPWASAVALGLKRFETRSWKTPYRGPLLIHAAQRWTIAEKTTRNEAIWRLPGFGCGPILTAQFVEHSRLRGCIVVAAELAECVPIMPSNAAKWLTDTERWFGDFSPGRFAWLLDHVVRLPEPVPCRGMQGLWDAPPDVLEAVWLQLPEEARTLTPDA